MSARIEQRLRQVLELLANANTRYTTGEDPDGEGRPYQGNDEIIDIALLDEAKTLLAEWDQEDATHPEQATTAETGGA